MNNKTIFQVDAFTDEPFKGNPAGVMFVDDTVSDDWMQNVAMEMNLSETAFLAPFQNGYKIRFFAPSVEIPLCGHATLASAHILYEEAIVAASEAITFHSNVGVLTVEKDKDGIVMDFPRYPLQKIAIDEGFKRLIGFEPIEMYTSFNGWVIAIGDSEETIAQAAPAFEHMTKNGYGHLMITAAATTASADFVCRCFAPISGINEDPVTGSAHCALTPLWAEKLGKTVLNSIQLSQRTGHLKVELQGDRVIIKGKAVTVFEASLKI